MMFKKKSKRGRSTQKNTMNDLSHSPLYLSEYEKSQLLGQRHPGNVCVYKGTTLRVMPVPTESPELPETDSCVWYQGFHDIYKTYYYHNIQTNQSQWEEPDEEFIPFGSKSMASVSCTNNSKRVSKPRMHTLSSSRGCSRHVTKQEMREKRIETLIEVTGCNREEAKRALKATKKDLDLATSLIMKYKRSSNDSDALDTNNAHPDQFYCSICLDIMKDPVCCSDGHSYCNGCIRNWLSQSTTSPMTNERLAHTDLIPNHALRSLITAL